MVKRLVVIYGIGGLADVGRHAVEAALKQEPDLQVTVITKFPDLLWEKRWSCGCLHDHVFSEDDKKRLTVVEVKKWDDADLTEHFQSTPGKNELVGIINCSGNRQPFEPERFHWDSEASAKNIMKSFKSSNDGASTGPTRVVVMSSCGVNEDWPPMEFLTLWRLIRQRGEDFKYWMMGMIHTIPNFGKEGYEDLCKAEDVYRQAPKDQIDYLLVRPCGVGDHVEPTNTWALQKEKHKDPVGYNFAKLDCARFMLGEVLNPTLHNDAVVIGGLISDKEKKRWK